MGVRVRKLAAGRRLVILSCGFSLTWTDPGQLCLGLTRRNEFAPGKASSGVAVGRGLSVARPLGQTNPSLAVW